MPSSEINLCARASTRVNANALRLKHLPAKQKTQTYGKSHGQACCRNAAVVNAVEMGELQYLVANEKISSDFPDLVLNENEHFLILEDEKKCENDPPKKDKMELNEKMCRPDRE